MLETDPHESAEPSVVDSVIRVIEAGQRIVLDRLDLARYDLAQMASRAVSAITLITLGSVFAVAAWGAVMAAAALWLQQYLSPPASLLLVATATAVCGAGAIAAGVRSTRSVRELHPLNALTQPTHDNSNGGAPS